MSTSFRKPEVKAQHEPSASEHEKPSTKRIPTEMVTRLLTSVKAKTWHTSKLFLVGVLTRMELGSKPPRKTVPSSATANTNSSPK